MTAQALAFFSNKDDVEKTSLLYHVAWMLADMDHATLAVDLDPQAKLSAAFLREDKLEALWEDDVGAASAQPDAGRTIYRCVEPLARAGDFRAPHLQPIGDNLQLLPGDPALARLEDYLSGVWSQHQDAGLVRTARIAAGFWRAMQAGAEQCGAEYVLVDVGPSLGAVNRAALLAADFLVLPLGADLFSAQSLRNLGPTLREWCKEWQSRLGSWKEPGFPLPRGDMRALGYLLQQRAERLDRPAGAYERWSRRLPLEYAKHVLGHDDARESAPTDDPNCLAIVKEYRSLIRLAEEADKPIFHLTAADGAIGAHATAAVAAARDCRALAQEILRRVADARRGG